MSNSTLRTLDHFFLSLFVFFFTPHKIQPSPALLLNTRRPRQLAHRRRRRQRTSLSTEPGSRPAAWLSQRQHRSLKCTRVTPERSLIVLFRRSIKIFPKPHSFVRKRETCLPQNEMVARRLLSSGGAHLLQIPWQAG